MDNKLGNREPRHFKEYRLTVSLRATSCLSDFIEDLCPALSTSLPIISGVAISGSPPDVIQVSEPWRDDKFLTEVISHLKALEQKYVPVSQVRANSVLVIVYGHSILRMMIEDTLKSEGILDRFRFVKDMDFASDSLGDQWPSVAVVADGATHLQEICYHC